MRLKDLDDSAFETWIEERESRVPRVWTTKQDFFKSRAWKEMRVKVFDAYGRRCMKCGSTTRIMQVDHIRPRSIRPDLALEFDNLQVLCSACNYAKGTSTRDYRTTKEYDLTKK